MNDTTTGSRLAVIGLPTDQTFLHLLIPYFIPYALYVAIEALPAAWLSPEVKQAAKLLAVALVMARYFRWYRLGKPDVRDVRWSVLAAPVAIILWALPLYYFKHDSVGGLSLSDTYAALRTVNSTLLVAVFEELFIRVYLLQLLFQAGQQVKARGLVDAIFVTFDQTPQHLAKLPLSIFSTILATLAFTAGHTLAEWPSAILFFLFTTYVYWKSNSIWVCILIHGIANLAIALLVRFGGMGFLW